MLHHIGQQLGNYRLLRLLGRGGFAEVYLGEHVHLNTLAAIKVLRTRLSGNDIANFREEARTIALLDHPNIVHVLDFDVKEDIPFLVMEYAPDGTLRRRHPKGQRVPLPLVIAYVQQMADALQHAHNQRFIHRDVKPENMLPGRYGKILLSDFGIATLAHDTSSQNPQGVAGTIIYMAPEQIRAYPRPASDQYSLGIVAYEWLCGEPPFTGNFTSVAAKHCLVSPPPLREKIPTISSTIEHVILTALAKDPQQRFTNVKAFADALEQAQKISQQTHTVFPSPVRQPVHTGLHATIPSQQAPVPPPLSAMSQATKRDISYPSRRTIIASMAGLALLGGGVSSFVILNRASGLFAARGSTSTTTPSHHPAITSTAPAATPDPTPAIISSQATVYIGSTDRNLYALKANDGSVLWHTAAGDWMNSRPAVANGVVYAGSNDHYFYACQASNGAVLWRYLTGDKVISWPAIANNVVYFGSWDQYIYALRVNDGSLLWRYQTGDMVSSPPQVTNGVVYIGSRDHSLYAIQASTGSLLWKSSTGDAIAAQACVVNGVVYVGSADHSLYAFRASDGIQLWQYQTGDVIYSTPEVNNGVIYFGSWDHTIYALHVSDHKLLWHYLTADKVDSSPAVQDGVVYISSTDGFIYALQADNGALLWHYQTGGVISSKSVVAGGAVYVGASNGLFALRTSDGSLLWSFAAGGGAATTPTIVS